MPKRIDLSDVPVSDSGEEILRTGDCAGFKAGVKDGTPYPRR